MRVPQLGQLLLAVHVQRQGSLLRLLQDTLWMIGFINDTNLLDGACGFCNVFSFV